MLYLCMVANIATPVYGLGERLKKEFLRGRNPACVQIYHGGSRVEEAIAKEVSDAWGLSREHHLTRYAEIRDPTLTGRVGWDLFSSANKLRREAALVLVSASAEHAKDCIIGLASAMMGESLQPIKDIEPGCAAAYERNHGWSYMDKEKALA